MKRASGMRGIPGSCQFQLTEVRNVIDSSSEVSKSKLSRLGETVLKTKLKEWLESQRGPVDQSTLASLKLEYNSHRTIISVSNQRDGVEEEQQQLFL
jgi:hypothetical protein